MALGGDNDSLAATVERLHTSSFFPQECGGEVGLLLVVECIVEPELGPQELHLLCGPGAADDAEPSDPCELSHHHGVGRRRDKNGLTGLGRVDLACQRRMPAPSSVPCTPERTGAQGQWQREEAGRGRMAWGREDCRKWRI